MKEAILPISEFKAKCLRFVEEVVSKGRTLIITKHGRPIVKVQPIRGRKQPLRDSWKGRVKITGDIVHIDTGADWEANL